MCLQLLSVPELLHHTWRSLQLPVLLRQHHFCEGKSLASALPLLCKHYLWQRHVTGLCLLFLSGTFLFFLELIIAILMFAYFLQTYHGFDLTTPIWCFSHRVQASTHSAVHSHCSASPRYVPAAAGAGLPGSTAGMGEPLWATVLLPKYHLFLLVAQPLDLVEHCYH